MFNPFGQAIDEAFWNIASTFDPDTNTWTDLGVPGFRGSTFSLMLPLVPDANGAYNRAEFLSAGGILGVSPGTYLAQRSAQINAVDIDPATDAERLTSTRTGDLAAPRWYGSGVLAPTGEVLTFSGADRDEVVVAGTRSSPLRRRALGSS